MKTKHCGPRIKNLLTASYKHRFVIQFQAHFYILFFISSLSSNLPWKNFTHHYTLISYHSHQIKYAIKLKIMKNKQKQTASNIASSSSILVNSYLLDPFVVPAESSLPSPPKYLLALGNLLEFEKSCDWTLLGCKQSLIACPNALLTSGAAATACAAPSTSSTWLWTIPSRTSRSTEAAIAFAFAGVGVTRSWGFCCSMSLRRFEGMQLR